ncbi:MAG: D-alanyl-D-alanine carboxypeptidase/D-alanyl-D-alanine-endopeptidase [Acidobacteriota bacterium]|nr:D-alanyl-D-alanine carboxypeptidase/D-alanyl-D-alanine-endopeptidase [Acidobacteriota bacterium]
MKNRQDAAFYIIHFLFTAYRRLLSSVDSQKLFRKINLMKKEFLTAKFTAIFVLAFFGFGLNFNSNAQTPTPNPRVIITNPTPSPTATPTPNASPTPATQTVSFLQTKIAMTLANPLLRRGQVGVKIISITTGKTIYERNAENYFMPASNMKSFTVAAALDKLSPDFRFVTSVYTNAKPDENGTIGGDLIIYGRGDPGISTAFNNGDYYLGIDLLAQKIVEAGVKKIEGSIVGDETYFNTEPIPVGWEWDDLQWYYGAEISSLSINDNAVDLKISPSSVGSPLVVQVLPANRLFKIINKSNTVSAGTKRQLKVTKLLGQNTLEISGTMPANDGGFSGSVTVSRPAELFVEILKQRLQLKGVSIRGDAKAINLQERNGVPLPVENYTEITNLQSPSLDFIAQKTMKPSQNLYTELILRALGETVNRADTTKTSEQKGIEVVQDVLRKAGVPTDSVVQYDASGLSRHNLITPNSAAMLFKYMAANRYSLAWQNALTIGGVDGTLKNRFKGTTAEANARGKTGTLDQVSALSGYVTSKSGEKFVFSILTNNIPNLGLRLRTIDDIVVSLANFDGITEQ